MYFVDQRVATHRSHQDGGESITQGQARCDQGDHGNSIGAMGEPYGLGMALDASGLRVHRGLPHREGNAFWRQQPFVCGACEFHQERVLARVERQAHESVLVDRDFRAPIH